MKNKMALLSATVLILVSLTSVTAYCLPEGSWAGTGTAVLGAEKARTCEKMNLQIYFVNGREYDFAMSAKCEGIYSETPSITLTTQGNEVINKGKVVGTFKDGNMSFSLPLDSGYRFEFRLKFSARTVDVEQKLIFGKDEVDRYYKGILKK